MRPPLFSPKSALSGLKSALSGLEPVLLGLLSALSGLKSALSPGSDKIFGCLQAGFFSDFLPTKESNDF